MVKVSRDQAAANRRALVAAAGRLFRQKGIAGVGVAELCNAAGMTHGALYSRFGSKEELAAEAFAQGQTASRARMKAAVGSDPDLAAVLDFYVSERHRDNVGECCPMLASASEAARQSKSFRSGFAEAFGELKDTVQASLAADDEDNSDEKAIVVAASMIGILAVARALREPDPSLSDALIHSSHAVLGTLARSPARAIRRSTRKANHSKEE